jgi:hypothetical protein
MSWGWVREGEAGRIDIGKAKEIVETYLEVFVHGVVLEDVPEVVGCDALAVQDVERLGHHLLPVRTEGVDAIDFRLVVDKAQCNGIGVDRVK